MDKTVNFVILGTQRTGTTLVRTCLSSHPKIFCGGELFLLGKRPYKKDDGYWHYSRVTLPRRIKSLFLPEVVTREFLDELYCKSGYSAVGFKLMLTHYRARPYILPLLVQKKVKVILVHRKNHLKTLVSRQTAAQSGVYHVSRNLGVSSAVETWKAQKIRIDTKMLQSDLAAIERETVYWRQSLGSETSVLEVPYESYCSNIEAWNKRLQDYLGVDCTELDSDLKKVNPDSLRQIILNYDEAAEVLRGSKYECFLE